MVHVQVSNENVVNLLHRDTHGHDILEAAGAEVEEEAVAVAQFYHDTCARLFSSGWEGATADERDSHLVWPDGLSAGEVVHPGLDVGRWPVVWRQLEAAARLPPVGIHGHVLRIKLTRLHITQKLSKRVIPVRI